MPRAKRNIEDGFNTLFAKRLRQLIEKKGITQNQLAETIGKTRQSVNGYTLGNTAPDSDTLIKLSNYFDVSVDYLLGISDVKTLDKDIKSISNYTGLSEQAVEELHAIYEMSLTGTCSDSALVIDEKSMSNENLAILNGVKSSCKNFLNCFSEFILDLSMQEMTDNISVYFELTQKLEKTKEQYGIHSKSYSNVKDKQDFYLFKISKNIQEAVKNIYEKERR